MVLVLVCAARVWDEKGRATTALAGDEGETRERDEESTGGIPAWRVAMPDGERRNETAE